MEADGRSAYAALAEVLHGTPLAHDFNDVSVSGPLWDLVPTGFIQQGMGHSLPNAVIEYAIKPMKDCLDMFDEIRTSNAYYAIPSVYTDTPDVTDTHKQAISSESQAWSTSSPPPRAPAVAP